MQIEKAKRKSKELGLLFHALHVPETVHQVIVYQAGGLQVGIDSGGAKELKSSPFQILCDGI